MTTKGIINMLKQGCPISKKLVKEIVTHLEMAEHNRASLEYYIKETQRLEDLLAVKESYR